jgi:Flp pilus assembly protein TadG
MPSPSTLTGRRGGFLCSLAPRFRHDQSGTSAIEFALLAAPFFIFLLLILEVGVVFLVGQALENATQEAARLIRTGQAQQFTRQSFATTICDQLWMFPNCPQALKVDVRVATGFGSADLSSPIKDGALDDSGFGFDAGGGDDIVVVRAFYSWPVTPALPGLIRLLGLRPELPPTGDYLLLSTAVFRNEPFS